MTLFLSGYVLAQTQTAPCTGTLTCVDGACSLPVTCAPMSIPTPAPTPTPTPTPSPAPAPSPEPVSGAVEWLYPTGVAVAGADLAKQTGPYNYGGWNAGAVSRARLSGDGGVSVIATETNLYRSVGLSRGDRTGTLDEIPYALILNASSQLNVWESGVSRGVITTYAAGDTLSVVVESGVVKYKRNSTVIYTSGVSPIFPLHVDTSFYSQGATISTSSLFGAWTIPTIELSSPRTHQVFSRSGPIRVSGAAPVGTWTIEARLNGGPWHSVATASGGAFSGDLTASGDGTVEVRIADGETVAVPLVGSGEVWAIAGQSNAMGYFSNMQPFSGTRGGVFGNDYVWRKLLDPVDVSTNQLDSVSADGAWGTAWIRTASTASNYLNVPVALVPGPKSGTSINAWLPASNHFDRTTLYGSLTTRINLTGATLVLWWQGESDALAGMSAATYQSKLEQLANAIYTDTGAKLMPCLLQNATGTPSAQLQAIRNGTSAAWTANSHIFPGPDLSGIDSDDAAHPMTDAKAIAISGLWWNSIKVAYGW